MLCLIILVYLLQVHCFDIEKLNRMYEGRYILDLQIFIFLPSLLVEYVERGHRQRRGGGGCSGDKYIFLFVNYNLEFGTNWKYTIYKIATQVDPVQSS